MKRAMKMIVALVGLMLATACSPPFRISTASDFGILEDSHPYDFRAATPDGLVIGVRQLEFKRRQGELEFWVKAIENELRLDRGYSLISARPYRTRSGLEGTQLRFGIDRDGEAQEYLVTVFSVTKGNRLRLFLVEAGGREELVDAHRAQIDWSLSGFVAR